METVMKKKRKNLVKLEKRQRKKTNDKENIAPMIISLMNACGRDGQRPHV